MNYEELPSAIIDVETTGLNPGRDQIIEFAVQKGFNKNACRKSWRIKPSIPIPHAAQQIHGISDDDVKDCPPFVSLASVIKDIFDQAQVIIGYNIKFDMEMIQGEFRRAHEAELDLSGKIIIDPLRLWQVSEPRRLENAVQRFLGKKHKKAHEALADVIATSEILQKMIEDFGLSEMNFTQLDTHLNPHKAYQLGPSDHFRWKNGEPTITFGKHKGTPLSQVDRSYLSWIVEKDFPTHVKDIIRAVASKPPDEFIFWVKNKYGPPPEQDFTDGT